MKQIPFYPNEADDMSCMVSVYRMLFDYYLNKKPTLEEMNRFVGRTGTKAAWTLLPNTLMTRQGFDIKMIEPFDYAAFEKRGKDYLLEVYSPEEYEWAVKNSNILEIKPYIQEFLRTVKPICRQPRLEDIDDMLREDRLVFVILNARVLNGKKGFSSHAVLVLQREGDEYIIHDPGLPPAPYRRVSRALLWQAMGAEKTTSEVTGFIYRNAHKTRRLDQYVVTQKPRLSRSYAAKLIEQGKVLVNGKPAKVGHKVQDADTVTIDYDESQLDQIPEIDLPVLYEDDDCIVINKPAGVLTHAQGKLVHEATVATFLRSRIKHDDLSGERAGIVHRLDRATSGVIICAKTQPALTHLQKQFADRSAQKTYLAVVEGQLKQKEAVIDMPIERNPKAPATFRVGPNGKPATTQYKVLQESASAKHSLVELKPRTGRTHQLRVHLQKLGHPIVGDPLYGRGAYGDRLYLHAQKLRITLPNGTTKTFTAPTPDEFQGIMEQ